MKASEAQTVDVQKGGSILKFKTLRERSPSQRAQLRPHLQGTESLDCRLNMSFWCERLNRISGLSTVHSSPGRRSIEGNLVSGHLWMTLDENLEKHFAGMAFSLSREIQYVERVSRIYASWGEQIVEIVFAGSERGLLKESMELIVGFFEMLAEISDDDSF